MIAQKGVLFVLEPFSMYIIKKQTGLEKEYIDRTILKITDYYDNLPQLRNNRIIYDYLFLGTSIYTASASIHGYIFISIAWLKRLIVYNDRRAYNALLLTIGHELGHKNSDFNLFSVKNFKFLHWTTEVHHDFYGAEIMTNSNRVALVDAIKYKCKIKPNNKDSYTHPPWNRRLDYVLNYDFGEELIKKIAKDTRCQNEILISRISTFYDPIVLK